MNRGAFVAGAIFTILGLFFLIDRLEIWDVRSAYVWPIMLIVLGVLVLLGARGRPHEPPS
jgi:hypothetical protein